MKIIDLRFYVLESWLLLLRPLASKIVHPRSIVQLLRRLFRYRQYDSSGYWQSRATGSAGQSRVLWTNEQYNELFRKRQSKILEPYVKSLPTNARVLDIGCGIGIVSKMLSGLHPTLTVDAVDFSTMVEVAQRERPDPRIHYIASPAEKYVNPNVQYDLAISSACFSAIRQIDAMETAVRNVASMIRPGGIVLMIDPFHRWNYLARAKYGSRDVIRLMKSLGFRLVHKGGVLFWPYRVQLASSNEQGPILDRLFDQGEWWLRTLGEHFWADYKVLAFQHDNDP